MVKGQAVLLECLTLKDWADHLSQKSVNGYKSTLRNVLGKRRRHLSSSSKAETGRAGAGAQARTHARTQTHRTSTLSFNFKGYSKFKTSTVNTIGLARTNLEMQIRIPRKQKFLEEFREYWLLKKKCPHNLPSHMNYYINMQLTFCSVSFSYINALVFVNDAFTFHPLVLHCNFQYIQYCVT